MREFVIFYAWQSDTPRKVGSDFIRIALEQARDALNEARLGVDVRIDSDTQGVPGSPWVTDTILEKIRTCDLFVGDMTLVAEIRDSDGATVKRIPNANVIIEFGYALHAKGERKILMVMNDAFGDFDSLPFDIKYLRKPAAFRAAADISNPDRYAEREALAGRLTEYIKTAIIAALAAPSPDQAMHERAQTRLSDFLVMGPVAAAPVLVSFPRIALHLAPLSPKQKAISANRVTDARQLLLPADGVPHVQDVDHAEWWSHGPTRPLPSLPNPVADWCTRLFTDGAIEATWSLGERHQNSVLKVDGCKLQQTIVMRTGRLLRALRALGFEHGAIVQFSLLGLEDVVLIGGTAITKQFRFRDRVFPSAVLAPQPEDIALAFQPAFELMWRAVGHEHGPPCS